MIAEPYLEGDYKKHSNNFGFVGPDDRNTPQVRSCVRWRMCEVPSISYTNGTDRQRGRCSRSHFPFRFIQSVCVPYVPQPAPVALYGNRRSGPTPQNGKLLPNASKWEAVANFVTTLRLGLNVQVLSRASGLLRRFGSGHDLFRP